MAEENTYTIDNSPQTETMSDNLTPDEQDSLAVGEKLVAEQDGLLAGKYKDAAELEKAYVELQKKLGSKDQEVDEDVEQTSATDEQEETSLSDGASLITSANDEYYENDGKLSKETLDKFSDMSSKELVEAYLEVQNTDAFKAAQNDVPDLTESEINQVKNFAGGETAYDNIIAWANTNLDDNSKNAFVPLATPPPSAAKFLRPLSTTRSSSLKLIPSSDAAEFINSKSSDTVKPLSVNL